MSASTLSNIPSMMTSPEHNTSLPLSSMYFERHDVSNLLPSTKYSMASSVLLLPELLAPIKNVASPNFTSTSLSLRKLRIFIVFNLIVIRFYLISIYQPQ